MADTAQKMRETIAHEAATYAQGEQRPLGSFLALMSGYVAAVGAGSVAVRRRGLPERLEWSDIALMAVATHKVSRLIARDPITSPLRMPFTRFEGTVGPAELKEEVRGTGARQAVGELITCPFCVSQWVATSITFGLLLAPRATRAVISTFTALTAADLLQFVRTAAEQRV